MEEDGEGPFVPEPAEDYMEGKVARLPEKSLLIDAAGDDDYLTQMQLEQAVALKPPTLRAAGVHQANPGFDAAAVDKLAGTVDEDKGKLLWLFQVHALATLRDDLTTRQIFNEGARETVLSVLALFYGLYEDVKVTVVVYHDDGYGRPYLRVDPD